jgi:hypothetical protein
MSGGNYNQPQGQYPQQGGYPQPQAPYGHQQGYAQVAPHRGGMILAFGILGFAVCGFFGIAAYIMGKKDLEEIRAGRMDRTGEGLTTAGYWLGLIAVILTVVGMVIGVGVVVLMMAAGGMR